MSWRDYTRPTCQRAFNITGAEGYAHKHGQHAGESLDEGDLDSAGDLGIPGGEVTDEEIMELSSEFYDHGRGISLLEPLGTLGSERHAPTPVGPPPLQILS